MSAYFGANSSLHEAIGDFTQPTQRMNSCKQPQPQHWELQPHSLTSLMALEQAGMERWQAWY